MKNTHVIKVGGENASDPRTAAWLAKFWNNWNKVAVAISALRTKPLNTTTELLKAKAAFDLEWISAAMPILKNLHRVHIDTLQDAGMYDNDLADKLQVLFEQYFPKNLVFPTAHTNITKEQRFVWYGEVMSAHVLSHLLTTRHQIANSIIDHSIWAVQDDRNLSTLLRDEIGYRVHNSLYVGIVIVPGYVSVTGNSIIDAYGRGYTDKTAERTAVGLANLWHSPILHIQKQVPMYSSHPGNISNVRPLWDISYCTAAEITWARGANAQVLNEHTITRELTERKIPIWVYNPFEDNTPKTTISQWWSSETGIQFLDSRDHVSTITVSGFAMSWSGLLARLTDLFARQSLSIDSISASETEVTFTTYNTITEYEKSELWSRINATLWSEYSIEIKNNIGMIYCIWDNLSGHPGLLEKITGTLARAGIDIECVSQSRWQRAVTIGVSTANLREGVKVLHARLIECQD